jgi:hypothetical protein
MLRLVLARIHNPGLWECNCVPECFCRRTRLGRAFGWYVPPRFHKFPNPGDGKADDPEAS